MTVLNCNNLNGDVITEKTARVMFYGNPDSIFNIYNNSKVIENGVLSHFFVGGVKVPLEYENEFYVALWWQFFKENPEVLKTILLYDEFNDGYSEDTINSPARIFKILKIGGMNGLGTMCKKFLVWLREERKHMDSDDFTELRRKAELLVNENYKKLTKDDILNIANISDSSYFTRLVSLVYDKKTDCITDNLYNMQLKTIKKEFEDGKD